jgi:hypothetical protein
LPFKRLSIRKAVIVGVSKFTTGANRDCGIFNPEEVAWQITPDGGEAISFNEMP